MKLLSKSMIETDKESLEPWKRSVYDDFSRMMTDREHPYPCVPGVQGFLQDSLRFGFAGDPRTPKAAEQFACQLIQYGNISRETGPYASIVIFFDTTHIPKDISTSEYEELFWTLLTRVHQMDEEPWPEHIPTNPSDPGWEFCFNGQPYFAFCATPTHLNRKSRHFPTFLIALQPRWVFEDIHDGTTYGRKLKAAIRNRLEAFDQVPAHPSLKWYGQDGNLEWQQYFLHDDNNIPLQCPFKAMTKQNQ
ncbi:YqcI/YcgG family protein [Halobacillus salinus]|uniref:YqcI/YcgG family protein n=1 Tax=Halobacillus salinus TaxID=192814 RepID=A0A4Z0GWU6_9BACI|nr:YqcI/YcgG family protein [Halobacillus salinus]TGB02270.1 YqcI/YcgG family protein [Halobacillus salinus]